MPRRILLIQGHPDRCAQHFGHALEQAYAEGARSAGHSLRHVEIAALDFPLLRSQAEWYEGSTPPALLPVQQDILWAEHLLLFFPLWMGDMPALVKAFLEQTARPGFAFDKSEDSLMGFRKALGGRSARVVVTMGMPAAVYRWVYRAHSVRSLERNILGFVGIAPVHETLVGSIESPDPKARQRWLARLRRLGEQGA